MPVACNPQPYRVRNRRAGLIEQFLVREITGRADALLVQVEVDEGKASPTQIGPCRIPMRDLRQVDDETIGRVLDFAAHEEPAILDVGRSFHPSVSDTQVDRIARRRNGGQDDGG